MIMVGIFIMHMFSIGAQKMVADGLLQIGAERIV
jgi:hypothetical protein